MDEGYDEGDGGGREEWQEGGGEGEREREEIFFCILLNKFI